MDGQSAYIGRKTILVTNTVKEEFGELTTMTGVDLTSESGVIPKRQETPMQRAGEGVFLTSGFKDGW